MSGYQEVVTVQAIGGEGLRRRGANDFNQIHKNKSSKNEERGTGS